MTEQTVDAMQSLLQRQREAFVAARPEPLDARKDRIKRAIALLVDHKDDFAKAMSADFGNRSMEQSLITDVAASVGFGHYCLKNLDHWAKPDKRKARFPMGLLGAGAEVRYEPKGVVGILSAWNFPIVLSLGPLMQVLAAGNRAMIKPSEYTERTSQLTAELIDKAFAPEEVAVALGGPDIAAAFSGLPFDHILFTGSTATGRKVMQAAAGNLTPVTLELGGKSPTIIGRSADVSQAGDRIAMGKMMNAGQICLAPDYLFVPEETEGEVIEAIQNSAMRMYPSLIENDDYASIINDAQFDRLSEVIEDAREKGARITQVNPANEDFEASNTRKMPLRILQNVTEDMKVMQEEIFGPVLPVKTYRQIDEAIDYVNANDRPLGLYYFGSDKEERDAVLSRTISGGVTVNDVMMHVSMDDLPFGGVGASGIGSYHGPEGFREFSHARSVFMQTGLDLAKFAGMTPPYNERTRKTVEMEIKKA